MPGLDPCIPAVRLVTSAARSHPSEVHTPSRRRPHAVLPPLWLFTDWHRLPDPAAIVRRLPPGLCGVVYRPALPRAAPAAGARQLRRLRQLCRARRIALSVAGPLGAAGCGEHRPGSRRSLPRARAAFVTASAHGMAELLRAERSGAALVFLSPVFPTASHPGAGAIGPRRWAALARARRLPILALGGIDGVTARRLPRFVAGAGAVGAMLA